MSTQAAFEEQLWSALLGVNDFRIAAHRSATAAELDDTYKNLLKIIGQAEKGVKALDQIKALKTPGSGPTA